MKITVLVLVILLVVSCVSQRELARPPEVAPAVSVQEPLQPAPSPPPVVAPRTVKYKSYLLCEERTKDFYNSSGIDVLPFVRVIFYDVDGDGVNEMIAGSKDGYLRLYENSGSHDAPHWTLDADYFDGIKVGAFSAPAAGDIDGDGMPEVLVGTGGFSKDSGKVKFYKNRGTERKPVWKDMDIPGIAVGNDATPALFDVDNDGRADLVVGNSTGKLFLFRARSTGNHVVFVKDPDYFKGIDLGMYVVPAVTVYENRIMIIAGNSMGKIYLLERGCESRSSWQKSTLPLSFSSFAAPTFIRRDQSGIMDMVISDRNGQITYFKNRKRNYRDWGISDDFFSGRILTGPASAPVITEVNGRSFMVVGNINGEVKLFAYEPSSGGLPWVERPGFFSGIKLSSFSRGILTEWNGRYLLITGQQDGIIRAFVNTAGIIKPSWKEKKQFFRGIPRILHAAPAVYDIDGDGKWELIVGDSDGYVKGFRYEAGRDGNPLWVKIEKIFNSVKVGRFAAPSLLGDDGRIYLFVGQQDGKISIFTADLGHGGFPHFYRDDYLQGVQVSNHSCPTAIEKMGLIELTVGDYNGNLKHFACHTEKKEIKDN